MTQEKEPLETYEERWLRVLSGGDEAKASAVARTPMFKLALYGIQHFNPPNGNKGKAFASRNFKAGSNLRKEKQ